MIKCLETSDENQCKSVALPVLGSGFKRHPPECVSAGMLKGIEQFATSHPQSPVKQVVIVIYGDQHVEISKVSIFLINWQSCGCNCRL